MGHVFDAACCCARIMNLTALVYLTIALLPPHARTKLCKWRHAILILTLVTSEGIFLALVDVRLCVEQLVDLLPLEVFCVTSIALVILRNTRFRETTEKYDTFVLNVVAVLCFTVSLFVMWIRSSGIYASWRHVEDWSQLFWDLSFWEYSRATAYSLFICVLSTSHFNVMSIWESRILGEQGSNEGEQKQVLTTQSQISAKKEKRSIYFEYLISLSLLIGCFIYRQCIYRRVEESYRMLEEQEALFMKDDGMNKLASYEKEELYSEYVYFQEKEQDILFGIIVSEGLLQFLTYASIALNNFASFDLSSLLVTILTYSRYAATSALSRTYFLLDLSQYALTHLGLLCVVLSIIPFDKRRMVSQRRNTYMFLSQLVGQASIASGLETKNLTRLVFIAALVSIEFACALLVNLCLEKWNRSRNNISGFFRFYVILGFISIMLMEGLVWLAWGTPYAPKFLENWTDDTAELLDYASCSIGFHISSMFAYGILSN